MAPITRIEYFRVPPRWLFVKVTDSQGNTGWGEASLEGHTEAVEGCLDAFIERFVGFDANDIEHIWQNGYRMGFYRGGPILMSALSGIDIALWDLKARRFSVPIYELLGGKVRDGLRVYAWIGGDRPGDVEIQARGRISQGFKAVKMNATEDLGWLDSPAALNASVERLKTVKSLGLDAGVDFHGRVHKAMAIQLAHKLAPHEPLFIEEPLLSEHPESVAALSKLVPIPIALGERLHSRWDVKPFLESASISILQPDISHVGGISELRRIAVMAEAYDVALAPHCPLGPIALAANIQVDAVSANFAIQEMSLGIHYNQGSADLETYIKNRDVWTVKDGMLDLPRGPGLGIELDEDKIRAATADAKAWRMMPCTNDGPASKRRYKERVRVTRACDACKKKKLRCTGTLPCASCLRTGKNCEYTAEYNRGKLPQVRIAQPALESEQQQGSTNEKDRSPSPYSRMADDSNMPENQAVEPPSRASPEAHQTDLEGHYVGPSSGVSFLLRAQRKLHKYVALPINTPIFTFGDSPLPEAESTFMLLPPRDEANALLARYFDFAFPTHRFLHQPQVEGWVEEFYRAVQRSEGVGPGMRGKRAVVLMVFAQAKQSQPDSDQSARSLIITHLDSAAYFAASEQQLSAETGPVRITSVQARLAQCFYLLSQSRINHCWSLFGTTARLAMTIGLHRARRRENGAGVDHIDSESRKRVFWCAYSLDNYLSAALGRPRIFHDDDIDQDFPTVADDSRILGDQILPPESTAQSIMLAPLYHAKLSVIIGRILRDMYGIRRSSQAEVSAATQHGADLTRWRQELSSFLDSPNVDLLMLTYQRQYTVLNLAFYHAQILLYRPFILRHFGSINRERSRNDCSNRTVDQYIKVCLAAAMKIAAIIRELCEKRRMYSTFWFTHYYAFSAIMILYLRVIQLAAQKGDAEEVSKYLQTGERAQRDLASHGSQSSFVQRYVVVLDELRQEARIAANQNDNHQAPDARDQTVAYGGNQGIGVRPDELEVNRMDVAEGQGGNLMPPVESNLSGWAEDGTEDSFPMPALSGLADWEGLDSLAVAGLGELDYLFCHAGVD
ncbi:hypothetical protein BO78DRAFT_402266 [Aspergillus sclerotiicarbonarius CBS 121057]|uniref:Zn(2)-C6 fungal-type domain-containing protein n=1 Tax=Aspergillus sclerotiicarbonarius (strain CBS 121057 / IBT 28362) TaxID=1448318 RepID=A0A319EQ33_ASPSB|nr:hypothetical protein BO78DRAFT_402266 [Aspergillus sclerotiicarbonarius CBS 121057]